jgi:hypothetical protein
MKAKDLTSLRFGKLLVICREGSDKNGHALWLCRCDCGNNKVVLATSLISGKTNSCGCYQKERTHSFSHKIDLTGERFGKLVVLKFFDTEKNGEARWLCECECKKTTLVRGSRLRSGKTTSCGCKVSETKKHGMTHGRDRPRIYGIWSGMKQRCLNPNVERYPHYGGRGITVCDEWRDNFQVFYDWAMANGYRDDLTIDRIDNEGNYEPENCQWISLEDNVKKRFSK